MKKNFFKYILIIVAVCGLAATTVGLITNIAGLFFTPIIEEFGVLRGSVALTVTICNIIMALGGLVTSKILSEKTIKPMVIICSIVQAGCTALLGTAGSLFPMYILNALRGLAGGVLSFVFITVVINNWFRKNVALITSIALGFSGIAGALLSPVVSSIISGSGWRMAYIIVGITMFVFNLPAVFCIPALNPATKGMKAYGEEDREEDTEERIVIEKELPGEKTINGKLLLICVAYAILVNVCTAFPQFFPGVSESYRLDASTGVTMLSICMISNSAGKIIMGAMVDRIGAKKSILIYIGVVALSIGLLFIRQSTVLIVASALFGMIYGLGAVGAVMVARDSFGLELYSKTYPLVSMSGSISNAVFSTVIGYINDFTGGYTAVLALLATAIGTALVAVMFIYSNKRKA